MARLSQRIADRITDWQRGLCYMMLHVCLPGSMNTEFGNKVQTNTEPLKSPF